MQSRGLTFSGEECPKWRPAPGVTRPTLPSEPKLMDTKATPILLIYKSQDLLSSTRSEWHGTTTHVHRDRGSSSAKECISAILPTECSLWPCYLQTRLDITQQSNNGPRSLAGHQGANTGTVSCMAALKPVLPLAHQHRSIPGHQLAQPPPAGQAPGTQWKGGTSAFIHSQTLQRESIILCRQSIGFCHLQQTQPRKASWQNERSKMERSPLSPVPGDRPWTKPTAGGF